MKMYFSSIDKDEPMQRETKTDMNYPLKRVIGIIPSYTWADRRAQLWYSIKTTSQKLCLFVFVCISWQFEIVSGWRHMIFSPTPEFEIRQASASLPTVPSEIIYLVWTRRKRRLLSFSKFAYSSICFFLVNAAGSPPTRCYEVFV